MHPATTSRLGAGLRTLHEARSHIADGAYLLFAGLLVLLAFLPTGISTTRQTISAYALSPEIAVLRLAFCCLAVGSLLAAYEFWRYLGGAWGRALAVLIGLWVAGDVADTVVDINPVGGHTVHGEVHAVVAVVAFSGVAATVLTFLGWLRTAGSERRAVAACASVLALVAVVGELSVTMLSATFLAGIAERAFFLGALVWMLAARRAVARFLLAAVPLPTGLA